MTIWTEAFVNPNRSAEFGMVEAHDYRVCGEVFATLATVRSDAGTLFHVLFMAGEEAERVKDRRVRLDFSELIYPEAVRQLQLMPEMDDVTYYEH